MSGTLLDGRTVAVVHEWFGATGGSESVFLGICEMVPQASRFVLWMDDDTTCDPLPEIRQSWLARTPLRHKKAMALPAMPIAWRTLTRQHFDVVISSSHAFAHTVKLRSPKRTTYLSYVHSPARYLWSPASDGRGSSPMLAIPRRMLRSADLRLGRHVDSYAANSREVRARIRRYWKRDATVIHPPVDVEFFAARGETVARPRDYLLGVGRWIDYKRFDLVIEIAAAVGIPLIIAGSGPNEAALRRLSQTVRVPVSFEVRPSKQRLRDLYRGALALLFPTHEDFGIVPVEAQACGIPVIGLARGGLLETVIDGQTGFLTDSTDPRRFAELVRPALELTPEKIQDHATQFSRERFESDFASWIEREAAG